MPEGVHGQRERRAYLANCEKGGKGCREKELFRGGRYIVEGFTQASGKTSVSSTGGVAQEA